jgi:pimeloyl-ACP methyl ester carboxylesterase
MRTLHFGIILLAGWLATGTARAQAPDAAYRAFFAPPVAEATPPLRTLWGLHYRGAMPEVALAFGRRADGEFTANFVGGQPDSAAARAAALANCARNAPAGCTIFGVNGTAEGRASIPLATQVIGPFRASPLHFVHGPTRARGVVIWSHGRGVAPGGGDLDSRNSPMHGWVSLLNDSGWDVLRFDRTPNDDEMERSTARLVAALPALRQAGYARIVLAGQSRGAWHSLAAAARAPEALHAVIAVAPAMHGADPRFQNAALDDWRRVTGALPAAGPRLAVVLHRNDAFDPLPSDRLARWEGQTRNRQAPSLAVAPEAGDGSHGGAAAVTFTQNWGPCLARFVNDAAPPTGTLRSPCPP